MELTGKCQEKFKQFCSTEYGMKRIQAQSDFYILAESMRYGVYVDFFDTVDIGISVNQYNNTYWYDIQSTFNRYDCDEVNTRTEARAASIEKANEIYNNI